MLYSSSLSKGRCPLARVQPAGLAAFVIKAALKVFPGGASDHGEQGPLTLWEKQAF
jgi:hypothetical protein